MPRRKTPKEYAQECKEKGYDPPIEDYINNSTKIKHRCKYGHIYEQTPRHHLHNRGCTKCNGNKKKTPEEYVQECKEKGYDLPIEDYVNAKTRIKHRCSKGHIYEQTPNNHLNGQGCSVCKGMIKKDNKSYYAQECKEKGYDPPIEDYVNARTKIKHICSKGHVYEQTPNAHLRGQGCSICNGSFKKTPEEYAQECKEKGYDPPIEDYTHAFTRIKHKCNKCHIYEQTPSNHLQNYGCPICKESHGERFIRNYLDKNNIKYESQKTFDDLVDKDRLSYDFYLSDYNILIEYQGIQHYESVSFDGKTFTNLNKQQHHDNLKRKYAKDNGYRLLELHYSLDTQDKVNRYLKRRIK